MGLSVMDCFGKARSIANSIHDPGIVAAVRVTGDHVINWLTNILELFVYHQRLLSENHERDEHAEN